MRLTKITTRTGDDGTTGLADGSRISKDSPRIEAIGATDELNSQIGLILTEKLPPAARACLTDIQHELFGLGGELATPGRSFISAEQVAHLDAQIEQFNTDLPPLKEFILPGGCKATALCHVTRAVCRRAERNCIALAQKESVSPAVLQYLNRLSDLLFILCRVVNCDSGQPDVLWQPGPSR